MDHGETLPSVRARAAIMVLFLTAGFGAVASAGTSDPVSQTPTSLPADIEIQLPQAGGQQFVILDVTTDGSKGSLNKLKVKALDPSVINIKTAYRVAVGATKPVTEGDIANVRLLVAINNLVQVTGPITYQAPPENQQCFGAGGPGSNDVIPCPASSFTLHFSGPKKFDFKFTKTDERCPPAPTQSVDDYQFPDLKNDVKKYLKLNANYPSTSQEIVENTIIDALKLGCKL